MEVQLNYKMEVTMGKFDISNITVLAKEYDINGQKLMIKPLGLKYIDKFNDLLGADVEKRKVAIDFCIRQTLKDADSTITDEQLDNLSLEFVGQMIDIIYDANGVKLDEVKAKLIQKIKDGQQSTDKSTKE